MLYVICFFLRTVSTSSKRLVKQILVAIAMQVPDKTRWDQG